MALLGDIALFSFDTVPHGWMRCEGQPLPINQNQALFSLLGTTYGGNGQTNFALPDLRGRVPIHFPPGSLGQAGGQELHRLTTAEAPAHAHMLEADATASGGMPGPGAVLGRSAGTANRGAITANLYGSDGARVALSPTTIDVAGGSQPHENRMPSLALSFCICVAGQFPSFT